MSRYNYYEQIESYSQSIQTPSLINYKIKNANHYATYQGCNTAYIIQPLYNPVQISCGGVGGCFGTARQALPQLPIINGPR